MTDHDDQHKVPTAPRAPATGFTRDARMVYGFRPEEEASDQRMTVMEALARWIVDIGFVMDLPLPQNLLAANLVTPEQYPIWRASIKPPGIPAKYLENVYWGLTSDEIFQDTKFSGTLVAFISDEVTIDRRVRSNNLHQLAVVRVLVESEPPRYAMDVAMRLWNLFKTKPGFSVFRNALEETSGNRAKIRRPDCEVREAALVDEPRFIGPKQSTFRLRVKYARF